MRLDFSIWDLVRKLWWFEDDGIKRDFEGSTIYYTSKSIVWRMFSGQTILQELFKKVYIKSKPLQEIYVDVCDLIKPCLFGKNYIFYFLLIIIVEKLRYIS